MAKRKRETLIDKAEAAADCIAKAHGIRRGGNWWLAHDGFKASYRAAKLEKGHEK